MNGSSTPASTMSSSTSSRESGDASRSIARSSATAIPSSSTSRPKSIYDVYHGDDSENEVEEELREREQDYGFRASSESNSFIVHDFCARPGYRSAAADTGVVCVMA